MRLCHCLSFGSALFVTASLILAAGVAIGDQGERPKKAAATATVFTEKATIACSADMNCQFGLAKKKEGNRISVRLSDVTVETLQLRMTLEDGRIMDAHIGDDGLIHFHTSVAD